MAVATRDFSTLLSEFKLGDPQASAMEDEPDLPQIHETPETRSLHFAGRHLQSRMLTCDPIALSLDYTKTMMGFLLFVPRPRRLAMIGLGGGSLARFCHHELPHTHIDVIEINSQVVALRDTFQIPPDGERFRIHIEDGADFIARASDCYDVVLLDGYTQDGIPDALASHKFHRDCRASLRDGGIMVSNVHGPDLDLHMGRIRRSYRDQVVWLDEMTCSNRTFFAFKCATGIAPARPRFDPSLLGSSRLCALLPSIQTRFQKIAWPSKLSVARR